MTAQASIYQRMSMDKLRGMAATEGEHQDEAARAYVDRLCDMELERRLDMRHNMPGWHPSSPGFGDGTGKSTEAVDAMYLAYEKGISNSAWHDHAKRALGTLPARRLLALMLATAKADRRLEGPFCATYDQIAASLGRFAQMLAMAPGVKALGWFKRGQAIKRAAWEARMELVMQAKVGVI